MSLLVTLVFWSRDEAANNMPTPVSMHQSPNKNTPFVALRMSRSDHVTMLVSNMAAN